MRSRQKLSVIAEECKKMSKLTYGVALCALSLITRSAVYAESLVPPAVLREWISQENLSIALPDSTAAKEPTDTSEQSPQAIEIVRTANKIENSPEKVVPEVKPATPTDNTPPPVPLSPKPDAKMTAPLPPPEFAVEVKPKLIVPTNPDQVKINRTQPISLKEVLEIAERNSRELKDAKLQLERARATVQEAKAGLNPTVNAQVEYTFQDSALARSFSSPTPYSQPFNGTVGLNYNLFTNGRVQADIRAAENNARLREVEVNRIQQTIRLNVITAYYNLQNADEQVRIRQKSVENNTRSLQDTQALERAGVGTKFDVLQAEVQLADAQQALQQAIGEQYNIRRNLARLLEFPPNVDLAASDPIVQAKDWELSLEDTIITALRNRADLDSTRLQKIIAQERARSVQAQLGPQVSVFANYGFADNFSQSGGIGLGYSLGARLNLSLFDGGVAKARLNQTLADQAIADNQFELTINQIRFEVEQAFSNLQSNRQQIITAGKAVESATEALRLARLRLSAGVGTQLEVIRTEEDLVRAEVNQLRAIVNFNRAIADLQRAINEI